MTRFASWLRATFVSLPVLLLAQAASAQVFINEIHYDNSGTDTGEAIEVAAAAGTDLTGWTIVLYNGSTGVVYGSTSNLSGIVADQQGGFGTAVINYPSNGLQNGSPDGIALVDPASTVVQFLSYEGSFVASGGPADGLTSTDIGVAESSGTAIGESLQLTGTGSAYIDFTWAAPQASTFGAVNTGQTFGDGGGGTPTDPVVVINEIDYDQPGTDAAEFIELKNTGTVPASLAEFSVQLVNGSNDSIYKTISLPAGFLAVGDYYVICGDASNTPRCDLDVSPNTNLVQNGAPDAVALLRNGAVVDAVSYEGDVAPPNVEGSGVGIADSGSTPFVSLSRFPDGADTDINNVDFSLRCTTPGAMNSGDATACPDPQPPIVINEIHADPASDLSGDANNDGVRDATQDEFVEIVNVSGGAVDISGWTLADGFSVRHTFPAGSVIQPQCSIVVFGGGSPTGAFGGATVQTASGNALGLNNGGDAVTINNGAADVASVSYGSEGGGNQSLTRDPDVTGSLPLVQHTTATGAGGALYSPGTKIDGSLFDGCEAPTVGPFEIFEIQGNGAASPYAGQKVLTQGNIVTALAPNGFFMQTPDSRSDTDVDTSDGIFVFTGAAPTVAVGDLVDVEGDVIEFFGFTEFSNDPAVTVTSAGLPLPTAITLDATTPSPDPNAPSCAIEFECYEGMLVEIANGSVTGPNQRFRSDPTAEVYITASSERTFREPGIEFPGLAGLPVWDGNPEVFELDPDKLGLPNQAIPAGSSFSATGVIGFDFGDYEFWPTSLSIDAGDFPASVRDNHWLEATVGSLNLFRLFDDVDDPPSVNALGETIDDFVVSTDEYQRRLGKAATYIVDGMGTPDILGVQEVESLKVLEDLAAAINVLNPHAGYKAYLVEGNDVGSIDVGFLVRKWRVWVWSVEQLGADETYVNPEDGSLDLLHDRPPLLLKGWAGLLPINVMVVHNRSLSRIETERVQVKRLEQALSIAQKAQDIQSARNPRKRNLVVLGDFNAFEFSDGYVDALGHIRGDFDPAESLLSGADLVEPDLMNQLMSLPEDEQYSFIFEGNAQALDHALTSRSLDLRVRGLQFARGNADSAIDLINDGSTALRASDHDGLVLYIYTFPGKVWKPWW
jgi:endonuclease/exonuclease/phosphatase family metal-dependent hydrolase